MFYKISFFEDSPLLQANSDQHSVLFAERKCQSEKLIPFFILFV